MVPAAGLAPALATLSTSCLCWLDYASKKSQSPVLPWAQRAYETCLSAGSTAKDWSPHPELHRAGFHTKEVHRPKCFGGGEIGARPVTLRNPALI